MWWYSIVAVVAARLYLAAGSRALSHLSILLKRQMSSGMCE